VKGPRQTLARNKVNAFRRGRWASLPDMVKPSTGACHVVGAGMAGTETCVTEGGLGKPGRGRYPAGKTEESERLIVAITPGESREQ